ncbi:MAG: hypothetical protein AB7P20_26285 [Rhizobiaceae bacterium]
MKKKDRIYRQKFTVTVEYDRNTGNLISKTWDRDGKLDCDLGEPAVTRYDAATGNKLEERWMKDNLPSRYEMDGPATIFYDPVTGHPTRHIYYDEGKKSRLGGAAEIVFDSVSGKIIEEKFYRQGRLEHPAPKPSLP